MQIVGEAGWQPCTCARQCMSPSRCQRERFGSFPVSIIVWFNCWLYAKRKYLLIILQKERSPAGRGAGVRRPGISRHDQQTCQPTCHTPTSAAATVIVTERDPEFTSSLTDLRRGAQAPYIPYACAILLSGVAQWSVFCFCPWNNPRDLHWRPHLSLGLACVCVKRDGSSASWESRWHPTVFNKGWTLSLCWHCSRTSDSDGRGDIGASTWARWACLHSEWAVTCRPWKGPGLHLKRTQPRSPLSMSHTLRTPAALETRGSVHSVEGDSPRLGLKSRDWGHDLCNLRQATVLGVLGPHL